MSNLVLKKDGFQDKFLKATNRYVALIAGFGSGKTFILAWKIMIMMSANPGCNGLVVSYSYDQMANVVIPAIRALFDELQIQYVYRASDHVIKTNWGLILFRTAEKPIRGFEVGWAAVDEGCLCPDEAFNDVISRIRDKSAKAPQLVVVSTPEGMSGFIYKNWLKKPLPDSVLIQGSTLENIKNLDPAYIEHLKSTYPPKLLDAYLYGQFVDFSGDSVYYAFNDKKHVDKQFLMTSSLGDGDLFTVPNQELILTCDFGSAYGCWTICKKYVIGQKTYLAIIDEVYQEQTNTEEMAKVFVDKYGNKNTTLLLYGDASGGYKQAGASQSNYQVLEWYIKQHFGKVVPNYTNRNPSIRERYNVVNMSFTGDAKFELKIHPRCEHLIEDLKHSVYMKDGSNRLDKTKDGGKWSHQTDSLGYLLMELNNPMRRYNKGRPTSGDV